MALSEQVLYRPISDTADVEIRTAGGKRELRGIVVPYGRPVRIDRTLTEQFRTGAFRKQLSEPHRVPLFRDHALHGGTLIGKALELREDAAGLYGAFRVSPTVAGDEALALVIDGALSNWSIGFRSGQDARLPGGITERVSAQITEVALVLQGAYGDLAAVADVRRQAEGTPNLDVARKTLADLPTLMPLT